MLAFREPTALRERLFLAIAAAFVVVGAVALHLAYPPFDLGHLGFVIFSFAISFGTAHVTFCRRLPSRDPLLLPTAALLSGWGLLMIGRLAPNFLARQTAWLLIATLVMLGVAQGGPHLRWLRRYRYTWLLAGLGLLATTLVLGVNPSGYGPRLWLGLGGAYFQPSEPLKLLMVVFLASYLAERQSLLLETGRQLGRLRLPPLAYAGPLLAMFGLMVLLLASQQDLGTAMLFFFTFLAMLYLATAQTGYVAAGMVLFLVAGAIGYASSARVAIRVDGWLNPWPEATDQTFQIVQSLLAVGTGGFFGQGIGLGRPTYIPAVHTDFVFAAICEEFGLLGSLAVIALYGILLLRGFRAAARAPHPFERLLSAGLTTGLVIQAWVITAGNIKVAPIAGVPFPFLSYGGSSLLATFISLGLIIRISNLRPAGPWAARGNLRPPPVQVAPVGALAAHRPLRHLAIVLIVALALLAVACGYWSIGRAGWLIAREDNPRRVEYEQRIVRGRILDRQERPLADVMVNPSGKVTRTYPVPEAAPVIGYASLHHGTGGIEAALDEALRGEAGRTFWEAAAANLFHDPPIGQDVMLALDADLQRLAQQALSETSGAIVLLDAPTGNVLAMASSPTFDPALLDQEWDRLREDSAAPLINRATQGLYQPGAALETVVLAEAVELGAVSLTVPLPAITATLSFNALSVQCLADPPEEGTMADAYRAACPAPFAALGQDMGTGALSAAISRWGLVEPPVLEVPTESGTWAPTDPAVEAVGQGDLTVTPLQMALVAATLANDGTMPAPQLAPRLRDSEGNWQPWTTPGVPRRIVSPETAAILLQMWSRYGAYSFGHLGTAVAGQDLRPHTWFLGVSVPGETRYAVAVLLEHPRDPLRAAEIGSLLLEAAQDTP